MEGPLTGPGENGAMPGEIFEYDADGLSMRGELYRPAGNQPAPLILIYPEATGPGAHPRDSAAKLADAGYACLLYTSPSPRD